MSEICKKKGTWKWEMNLPCAFKKCPGTLHFTLMMGASWELLIKLVKWILRAITTDRIFIDKTLPTYLCELESIFNKDPLTPISNNIRDFGAIKPNNLLTGYQNHENSFTNSIHCIKGLQNPCKTVQSCANLFWNCWTNYYLPTPTSHTK